ncbi:MAG: transglutaminase domain-containing protein [Anaerolineae bacterium]|nr:DUF3488 and transglutaminase-like domain-containing protein [Anaerolineae bacterium]MDW8099597.1 transglutaminase domain-containing protein [Anaerolineae bacterium]
MLWMALFRLYRRLQPREGWLVFVLTLGAVAIVPASAQDMGWVPGLGRLIPVAMSAVLFGFLLARLPFSGWIGSLLSLIVGIEFVLGFVARVMPPLGLVWAEGYYAVRWLFALSQGVIGRAPFLPVFQAWWDRLWDFWARVAAWAQGVSQGGTQQDNLLFLVYMALIVWGLGVWAGWWVFRRHEALAALVPAGLALASNLFFARAGETWAVVFTASLLLLLMGLRHHTLEEGWTRKGLDYSEEIRVGLYMAGGLISAAILALMPIVPTITSRQVADWFWDLFSSPWRRVEESAERMFPELERPAVSPLRVSLGGTPDQMPRVHLLGGSPELGRRVALRVRINQPSWPDSEKWYYRAITYADYSGRGWSNEDEPEIRALPPGQPWDETVATMRGRKRLLQSFEVIEAPSGVLYAVGEPLAPDVPYEAKLRAPGDLISLEPPERQRLQRYTVLSAVPAVSEEQLRAANHDYPEEIRTRYLALPEIPQHVRNQAREIVAGLENRYDQAVAIETYLRGFEYTLEIEEPPPDRDVVDYFLFDLKKGYCDYYASAMVVMARAVGIPARLAVGYSTGSPDQYTSEYTVTEAEAHSWPELYFPPYGWIPFEPTANRSTFPRIGLPETGEGQVNAEITSELPELPQWGQLWRQWLPILGVIAGVLAFIALAYLAWEQYQQRTLGPVTRAYASLLWWGRRLGRSHNPSQTPRELGEALARQIERIAQASRRGRRWLYRWQTMVINDLITIAEAYTEEVYAARPTAEAQRRQVYLAWRRLQKRIWAFWVAHWL